MAFPLTSKMKKIDPTVLTRAPPPGNPA